MSLQPVQMYGGMRGIRGLVTETSLLDPEEVRGRLLPWNLIHCLLCRESVSVVTVSQSCRICCQRPVGGRSLCRKASSSSCSLARSPARARSVRAHLSLSLSESANLLAQVDAISADWAARADIPQHVVQMVANFPNSLPPMSQFSAAITAMQLESKFARAYAEGMPKTKYWEVGLSLSLSLSEGGAS